MLSRDEALAMAEDEGLDLVEIQPNADPPVCKIMDFGKFKFEQQKKANEAKKKTKQQDRDQGTQVPAGHRRGRLPDQAAQHARFSGRRQGQGQHPLPRPRDEPPGTGPRDGRADRGRPGDEIVIESRPRLEGRQMVMMIAPRSADRFSFPLWEKVAEGPEEGRSASPRKRFNRLICKTIRGPA